MFDGGGQLDAGQRGPVKGASTNQQTQDEYAVHQSNSPKP